MMPLEMLFDHWQHGRLRGYDLSLPDGTVMSFSGLISQLITRATTMQGTELDVTIKPVGTLTVAQGDPVDEDTLDDLEGLKEDLDDPETPDNIRGEIEHDVRMLESLLGQHLQRQTTGAIITCDGETFELLEVHPPRVHRQQIDVTTFNGQTAFIQGIKRASDLVFTIRA